MTRLPLFALALAALVAPAFAQEAEAPAEGATDEVAQDPAAAEQPAEGEAPAEAPAEGEAAAEPAGEASPEPGGLSESQGGTGALVDAEGNEIGNASISATASGHTVVLVNAEGVPEGVHGVHIHMVGACEGPTFESAGEHLGSGESEHGVLAEGGPHVGDLPNATVGPDGQLAMDGVAIGLTLDMVFDEDGSALIVHAEPDDYASQPGGNSGDRIACAVIELPDDTVDDASADAPVTEEEAAAQSPEASDDAEPAEPANETEQAVETEGEEATEGTEGEAPAEGEAATEGSGG